MLRNIDYQLEPNSDIQQKNEQLLAPFIQKRFSQNLQALAQCDPQLGQALAAHQLVNFAPFVNRFKHLNIVYTDKGRALYGASPEREVTQQLADFWSSSLNVELRSNRKAIQENLEQGLSLNAMFPNIEQSYQAISADDDALVIFGVGLGLHLAPLIKKGHWKKVLLIEPDFDLLQVSLMGGSWKEFFNSVSKQGCNLTISTGLKGKAIVETLVTWSKTHDLQRYRIFKHYNHSIFNKIEWNLAIGQANADTLLDLNWSSIDEQRDFEFAYSASHYLIKNKDCIREIEQSNQKDWHEKNKNSVASFSKYFPEIATFSQNHTLVRWVLISTAKGQYNLFDTHQGTTLFSGDPQQDVEAYFKHYSQYPKLDALDARGSVRKRSPYLHYKYSDQLKTLVRELPEEKVSKLPYKLPSFLMYGCSMGYQIEHLLQNHDVDNFILYEPNVEFFIASLGLIDWSDILLKADEREAKLYLNLGDDGQFMFDDILSSLQSSGIHVLSYTFFYVSYFQQRMDENIRKTREQLKVQLNISEFFDHSFFNISHTLESIRNNNYFLTKQSSSEIEKQMADTPVFILGNGPSLDESIETIKEYSGQAIIISCGTGLKALYEYGIKPDFHCEVEQTRSTLSWVCQVPDPDWLKSIDLLVVNGVHPEVSQMFRSTLNCFKEGEAGLDALWLLSKDARELDHLNYSYPTVTNGALSYALKLGFKQIYLFGVDLGFSDQDKHHSKHSAYYKEDGNAIYNYRRYGTSIRVPGNFQDYVFTKNEFKLAADIMAQALGSVKGVDCFNTSNGAFIAGTLPLLKDNVLLLNDPFDKDEFIAGIKEYKFKRDLSGVLSEFDANYTFASFESDAKDLLAILNTPAGGWEDVLSILDGQVNTIKQSLYHRDSLFFFLLRGSAAFSLTYLTRLAFSCENEQTCVERFEQGRAIWIEYIEEVVKFMQKGMTQFDQTPAPYRLKTFPALDVLKERGLASPEI